MDLFAKFDQHSARFQEVKKMEEKVGSKLEEFENRLNHQSVERQLANISIQDNAKRMAELVEQLERVLTQQN